MELYNKLTLKTLIDNQQEAFYMPKSLFKGYKTLRLETKLAYVDYLLMFLMSTYYIIP